MSTNLTVRMPVAKMKRIYCECGVGDTEHAICAVWRGDMRFNATAAHTLHCPEADPTALHETAKLVCKRINTTSSAVAGIGRLFRDVDLTVSIGLIEETES